MKAPILVITADSGDIYAYRSQASAIRAMEPIDVRDGLYRVFDAQGLELEVSVVVEEKHSWLFGKQRVEVVRLLDRTEPPFANPGELLELIRTRLQYLAGRVSLDGVMFTELTLQSAIAIIVLAYMRE